MQKFIALLFGVLLGMMPSLLPAQQNQNPQQSDTEVESLKKRVLELEKQLQSVENAEKMDLQAKLADAHTKLANSEFGKFERRLRDSNDEWLRAWSTWFLVIIGTFVVIIGGAFWFLVKSLIANTVEKNLNGFKAAMVQLDILKNQQKVLEKEANTVEKSFKETVDQLNILKDQQRLLEKERAAAMLEDFIDNIFLWYGSVHPERIKGLREEALLDVFGDEDKTLAIRYRAAEVLAARKSPQLVASMLKFLNMAVDSDSTIQPEIRVGGGPFVNLLGEIHTRENYEGLTKLLTRLFTENQQQRDFFLTWTALSLAEVSIKLDVGDSASILRRSIPHLKARPWGTVGSGSEEQMGSYLESLVRYFDILEDPETIKKILSDLVIKREFRSVENQCLRLLQKYDPEFVAEWRAGEPKENSNA